MKNFISFLLLAFCVQLFTIATTSDVLLTIDTTKVTAEEFMRIYNKNSSITVEEKKTIDEYLDLFINYKLKVVEAVHLGYDTVPSFIKEIDGYADQLAEPYMSNDEFMEIQMQESYERYNTEINASHILLPINPRNNPEDTLEVYNKLLEMRKDFYEGVSFDTIIKNNSPSSFQPIGGNLGWFGTMKMVYPFEIGAYSTPVNEVSMPVRTQFGYHLIKVNGLRQNRGEINISHVMVMYPQQHPNDLEMETSKSKIMQAYTELEAGAAWDSVVAKYSEHRSTKNKGGKLGWLSSGMVPDTLLDICFLLEDGQYAEPFASDFGWHIVKLHERRPVMTYEEYKEKYESRIKQLGTLKKQSIKRHLQRIKDDYGFEYDREGMNSIFAKADSTWLESTWRPDEAMQTTAAFKIGEYAMSQSELIDYLIRKKKLSAGVAIDEERDNEIKEVINRKLLKYERQMLPVKHPEYKYLLQEYFDGILLFNLTEEKVWNKAVQDSTGLSYFYSTLDKKYKWDKRVVIAKYTYPDSTMIADLKSVGKKRLKNNYTEEEVSALVCGQDSIPCVNYEILTYEKGDNSVADSIRWKKNSYLSSKDNNGWVLYYVENILPAKTKELFEARGLYTADYQSFLEDKWIEELRSKYTVTINQEVLEALISQE